FIYFCQAEDGIRDFHVTGVQTCALPICGDRSSSSTDSCVRAADGKLWRTRRATAEMSASRANRQCSASCNQTPGSREPDKRGNIERPMIRRQARLVFTAGALLLPVACGPAGSAEVRNDEPVPAVLPGLEVLLRDSAHLVRGRRVGFLTNQTAVTSDGRSGIDLLHASPDIELVALFGPEHGLRGGVEGGVKIESGVDGPTGVPVHSLYGSTQRPTPDMLRGVDVLLFDMQDIGARPYTFVWTMAMAME